MANYSITSSNSIIAMGVTGLLPVPTILQGYAADDIFTAEAIDNAEMLMGLDGKLSAGWIPVPVTINFMLQANSISMSFFEAWYAAEQSQREKLQGFANITLVSIGRNYTCINGFLRNYSPIANAQKVLQPRSFSIAFESVTAAGV